MLLPVIFRILPPYMHAGQFIFQILFMCDKYWMLSDELLWGRFFVIFFTLYCYELIESYFQYNIIEFSCQIVVLIAISTSNSQILKLYVLKLRNSTLEWFRSMGKGKKILTVGFLMHHNRSISIHVIHQL